MILHPAQPVTAIPGPLEGEVEATVLAMKDYGSPAVGTISDMGSVAPVILASGTASNALTFGSEKNGSTVTIVVNAPAANPTDKVLVAVTGSVSAMVITITPNDGTHNSATAVTPKEFDLTELIPLGTIFGINLTLTDTNSLLSTSGITGVGGGDNSDLVAGTYHCTLSGGVNQELDVIGKYFLFSSSSVDYYGWFSDGAVSDPSISARTGVEIVIADVTASSYTAPTAELIAVEAAAAIDALAGLNSSADGDKVLVWAGSKVNVLNATGGNSGLSCEIKAQGVSAQSYRADASPGAISNQPTVISSGT